MIESPVYGWIVEEGIEKGIINGKLDDAKKMLEEGLTVEFIQKITGLSIEKILELKNK